MLAEVVAEAARRFGDSTVMVTPDGWAVSYAELHRLCGEVAAGLAARGVGKGDVVALVLPSTPEYVVAYLALAKLGAVTVGVNPRLAPAEQVAALDVVRPSLALATADLAEGVPHGVDVEVVTIAADAASLLAALRSRANGNAAPVPVELTDDDPVAIVLTSGTTGRPKGAWFTNRQLRAITTYDLGPDGLTTWGGGGPMLASTQFAHVGFMTKLPWSLRQGTTLHLLGASARTIRSATRPPSRAASAPARPSTHPKTRRCTPSGGRGRAWGSRSATRPGGRCHRARSARCA